MSEQIKIFRGDHAPEEARVEKNIPAARKPAPVPAPEPEPTAAVPIAAAPAPQPPAPATPVTAVKAEPALEFRLDDTQLFHTPDAVRQRMAQMAAVAHTTAHLLDEQAEESERIARRLKSL